MVFAGFTSVMQKKLRIGWFTFTCCEDSTVLFTEIMNDHFETWMKVLDIRHARVLQSKNVLDEMDVAFIEGAIISDDQVPRLKEIRGLAKKVVAIGQCAITGKPSSQRNEFNDEQNAEIADILERFNYADKVRTLSDVITVDDAVPGCPMSDKIFLEKLDGLLKEFKII